MAYRPLVQETFCMSNMSSEKDIISSFTSYITTTSQNNNLHSCFERYFYKNLYEGVGYFYFGFLVVPSYYTRFINKYNKVFKNIHIDTLCINDIYSFHNDMGSLVLDNKPGHADPILHKSVLFRVRFSNDYAKLQKTLLGYVLHHSLRLLSLGELFIQRTDVEHPKNYCSIQKLVDINNAKTGGRSLSEGIITKEHILLFDDINSVNNGLKSFSTSARQTRIVSRIYNEKHQEKYKNKFKCGDLVVPLDSSRGKYSYTVDGKMFLGIITEVLEDSYTADALNDIKVKVLVHIDRVRTFDVFPVQSLYFRLITDEELLELNLNHLPLVKNSENIREVLRDWSESL